MLICFFYTSWVNQPHTERSIISCPLARNVMKLQQKLSLSLSLSGLALAEYGICRCIVHDSLDCYKYYYYVRHIYVLAFKLEQKKTPYSIIILSKVQQVKLIATCINNNMMSYFFESKNYKKVIIIHFFVKNSCLF